MKTIRLRAGRERSLQRRHPWVFDGSVAGGRADVGETVRVEAHDGRFLAWGAYSPASSIRVRAWSFDEAERIDRGFFARRIAAAIEVRAKLAIASDALRLVHGEADGLPGLVVDRYADTMVAQFGAAGVERWRETIADALVQACGGARLYERSDAAVRARFDHGAKLRGYSGPLLVLHASDDDLVDVSHAERNHASAGGADKQLVTFARGGHNGLLAYNWPRYVETLGAFFSAR